MSGEETIPFQPCGWRLALASTILDCERREGHTGIHLAPIRVNGIDCETGWKDSDPSALAPPEAHRPASRTAMTLARRDTNEQECKASASRGLDAGL